MAFSSHGASAGAFQPVLAFSRCRLTCAPYGGSLSSSLLQQFAAALAVQRGRQAQAQLHRGVRTQHVAGRRQCGQAVGAGDRQRGSPRAVEHQFGQVAGHRRHAGQERELVVDLGAQHLGDLAGLQHAFRGNLDVHAVDEDAAGGFVLDPRQQLADDAEAGRHDAGGVAGVHAFLEHLHRQVAAGHAAQRGGAPQLVVVAAARIQADHQRRLADALGQVVDIGGQVVAAGFLAGLDQHHAARMRSALCLQRHHRGQRTVDRVAVVGATAAVQAVAFHHRFHGPLPRPSRSSPAACRGGRRAGCSRRCDRHSLPAPR
jgi:hypothetical protein